MIFFYWGSAPQGEGKNVCLCRCQQPGKGFWLLSTIQVQKKNKPSDIDAKGLVQYFHQAWKKKQNSLTLSLHSQTEHTSQSKNTGMASVGVCQTDGMRFVVFDFGFTLKSHRIVPTIVCDMFASDYSQCEV